MSRLERVRAGMELLGWTYRSVDWDDQIWRREVELRERWRRDIFGYNEAWRLLEKVRSRPLESVSITASGLLLTERTISAQELEPVEGFAVHLWRDERHWLVHVSLVSSGWDVICLRFAQHGWEPAPLLVIPVPEPLKADVQEVAKMLWRKTLGAREQGKPPTWR